MSTSEPSTADYCRQLEAYLCRRNDGHLIRIVGPAFELVSAWSKQGIPIKVACQGIDRYIDRQNAKAPRRRPVRIEFCEADILDAFDQWRRAVGAVAGASIAAGEGEAEAGARTEEASPDIEAPAAHARRVALQAHIDRVMARLTQRRLETDVSPALGQAIEAVLRDLDALRPRAHGARGERREEVTRQLRELDATLVAAVRASRAPEELARLDAEARRDLHPFRERMPKAAFDQAIEAAAVRLLRDAARVPEIAAGV